MSLATWRSLESDDRALVAIAVLMDGSDAALFLECDSERGAQLRKAAEELSSLEVDVRLAFVGTALRLALGEAE